MANHTTTTDWDLESDLQQRIRPMVKNSSWVLRVTEYKDKPVPVLVVKKRFLSEEDPKQNGKPVGKATLKDQGLSYGHSLRRSLPVIREVVSGVCDPAGVPLELQRFFSNGRITFRGNLPLDSEAGTKLALIFKLQERLKDMDRAELIAWRVERFSYEEASYWLTRATLYGEAANRWAQAGMRLMLGGQSEDKAVLQMLEKLRK